MNGTYTKGQHLLLDTEDGMVRGIFHSKDDSNNQLTLMEVMLPDTGDKLQGLCHFYANEIKSVRVLEAGTVAQQNSENSTSKNYNLMRRVPLPLNPGRQSNIIRECDVVANFNPQRHKMSRGRRNTPMDSFKKEYEMIQKYVYVKTIEVFEKAMMALDKEEVVAVEVVGVDLGWAKRIGLINIATRTRTILFDIQMMGSEVFDLGLRELLESDKVLKVVHNCRMLSQFLLHEHNVRLANIFDTQVADLIRVLGRYGDLPMAATSVQECIILHLDVPECLLHKLEVRDGYIEEDFIPWITRPLHLMLRQAAVKNAVFLLPLRMKMLRVDPELLTVGTELYLKAAQDPSQQFKFYLVPSEMQELVGRSRKRYPSKQD